LTKYAPPRTEDDNSDNSIADMERGHAVRNIKPHKQTPVSIEDGTTDIETEQTLEDASSEEDTVSMHGIHKQDMTEQDAIPVTMNGIHHVPEQNTASTGATTGDHDATEQEVVPLRTVTSNEDATE